MKDCDKYYDLRASRRKHLKLSATPGYINNRYMFEGCQVTEAAGRSPG